MRHVPLHVLGHRCNATSSESLPDGPVFSIRKHVSFFRGCDFHLYSLGLSLGQKLPEGSSRSYLFSAVSPDQPLGGAEDNWLQTKVGPETRLTLGEAGQGPRRSPVL